MTRRDLIAGVLVLLLIVANGAIYWTVTHPQPTVLKVSFLNIGQGDSILIQSPTGEKLLVDGGPDRSVLRELSRELGPLDRSVDMLVETHPDKDHISGLADVLAQYQVSYFMSPGIPDTTAVFKRVEAAVTAEPGIVRYTARRGMRIHLGGGAYADVLFPDTDESHQTITNNGSTVLHIHYGTTSFMLTGDLPSPYEDHLVALDGGALQSDVLKAGHHGSKYSTDNVWLATVRPSTVVISAGKDNTYGHPNPQTISRIQHEGAKIVSTIDHGTIDFTSNGTTIQEKDER
jgi:competence protein ComEC